jgi:hypothetical protein
MGGISMSKTLSRVLIDEYDGQWSSFPNATDTLEDYGNISWRVENPPSESDLKSKGVFETSVERQVAYDAQKYARNRKAEYPDMGTQFNKIYDDGIDAWKTDMVDPIKAKYPKP